MTEDDSTDDSTDDTTDHTWEFRDLAFGFSQTIFVEVESETQLVFRLKPCAEFNVVKEMVKAGGGYWIKSKQENLQLLSKKTDYSSHKFINLMSINEKGY